jgi:hypothetical protein
MCYRINTNVTGEDNMKKEDTSVRIAKRNYEARNKELRKAQNKVWGTSLARQTADSIDSFLKKYGFTKVQLIEAGYKALLDEAAEHDLDLAKIMDGYDDFFPSELEKMK